MFVRDQSYTRSEIHDQLGGGLQDFLPHVDGRVVCVCVTPELNPDAPDVLLVGGGEDVQRYASALVARRDALSVFLKRAANEWQYRGEYAVTDSSSVPADIARWSAPASRKDVTMVVFMQARE
jgi:hypothetical protein